MCACTCGVAEAFGYFCSERQHSETKDHFFTMAKRVSPGAVIDLTLDSDDEKESRLGDIKKNLYSNKKFKAGHTRNAAIDNDVVIIDAPALKMVAGAPAGNIGADDDLEVIGIRTEWRLPHLRQHCTHNPFWTSLQNNSIPNEKHCDLCYCYCCDCPVKDCKVSHFLSIGVLLLLL
jgi:hypothetical protein